MGQAGTRLGVGLLLGVLRQHLATGLLRGLLRQLPAADDRHPAGGVREAQQAGMGAWGEVEHPCLPRCRCGGHACCAICVVHWPLATEHVVLRYSAGMSGLSLGLLPGVLRLRLWSPHEQPVVDIAQRVGHEGLRLIVAPLPINNELILVVPVPDRLLQIYIWQGGGGCSAYTLAGRQRQRSFVASLAKTCRVAWLVLPAQCR